jgi:hypothetical protein
MTGMSLFHDYVYPKSNCCLSGKRRRTSQPSDDEDLPTAGMCQFQEAICLKLNPCPSAKKQHVTKSMGTTEKKYRVVSDDEDEGDGDIFTIPCMCHSRNHPQ